MKKATYVMMILMVLVFLADALTAAQPFSKAYLFYGDNSGVLTAYGRLEHVSEMRWQLWRLVTNLFLHAGVFHLLVNLAALFLAGTILEREIGRGRFVFVFFAAGVSASLVTMLFVHGAVGASGGIYGLVGCLLFGGCLHRKEKLFWVKVVLLVLYLILPNLSSSTAISAHLTGFLVGSQLGVFCRRRAEKKGSMA